MCGPVLNFFPKGFEDDSLPGAWSQTAQVAAGNTNSDQLYTIALTSNKNVPGVDAEGPPVLQVLPVHDLLTVGATPSRSCMGYGATAVRHLLEGGSDNEALLLAAAATADSGSLASGPTPAARRLAQAAASGSVTIPAKYRVQYTIGKNYSADLGEFKVNGTQPAKIALNLSGFADVSRGCPLGRLWG